MPVSSLLAFVLRVRSGLKVRLWDPTTRLFHTSFPQAWLLEGREMESDLPLKVLLFGDSTAFNYIALTIFKELPAYQSLGRTAFWRWSSLLLRHGADLFYGESTMVLAQHFSRRRGFCLPEYVDALISTASMNFSRSSGKIWLQTSKEIQEKNWTMRVSKKEEDFLQFYHDHYVPTAMRKFEGHRYIMPLSEMRILFRMGILLQICQGDRVLGGILAVERKRELWLGFYGGLEDSPGHPIEGLQSASYYFGAQYSLQCGRAEVNFGSSRPYFQDGIYQHKRRWKARFEYTPQIGRCYWFVPNLDRNSVRRYLNRCPFIAKNAQGLEGVFFYDPAVTNGQTWEAFCRKNYMACGVESARFVPLEAIGMTLKRSSDNKIHIPSKLEMLWPVFTAAFLEGLSRVRSKGKSLEYQRFYRKTPRMPIEDLRRLQREKLIAMLLHARQTVPHFQSLLKEFKPSQFSEEWFRTLPIMDRQEIALKPDLYRTSARLPGETKVSTSGTTSHPLILWVDRESIDKREIVRWRGRDWWGLQRGDRHAHLWGREKYARWRRRFLERWLENAVPFDGYHFTSGVSERCYDALQSGAFKYVYGFASVIAEMAAGWLDQNRRLPEGCIEAVIIPADMISDAQKQMIWRAFGCPVAISGVRMHRTARNRLSMPGRRMAHGYRPTVYRVHQ